MFSLGRWFRVQIILAGTLPWLSSLQNAELLKLLFCCILLYIFLFLIRKPLSLSTLTHMVGLEQPQASWACDPPHNPEKKSLSVGLVCIQSVVLIQKFLHPIAIFKGEVGEDQSISYIIIKFILLLIVLLKFHFLRTLSLVCLTKKADRLQCVYASEKGGVVHPPPLGPPRLTCCPEK